MTQFCAIETNFTIVTKRFKDCSLRGVVQVLICSLLFEKMAVRKDARKFLLRNDVCFDTSVNRMDNLSLHFAYNNDATRMI